MESIGALLYAAAKLNMSLSAVECFIFFGLVLSATLIFTGIGAHFGEFNFLDKGPNRGTRLALNDCPRIREISDYHLQSGITSVPELDIAFGIYFLLSCNALFRQTGLYSLCIPNPCHRPSNLGNGDSDMEFRSAQVRKFGFLMIGRRF